MAVLSIARAVVHQISSIPINSPLRTEKHEIFDIFGALQAMHDMYLMDDIADFKHWAEFWSRSQPVLFELGIKLDEKGYGFSMDELNALNKGEGETDRKPQ